MISFSQFKQVHVELQEATSDMLDISILNIDKVPLARFKQLLDIPVVVEEKFDGTKISIVRSDTPFDSTDFNKNWIVAYKNSILYPEETNAANDQEIQQHSIGSAQYKVIFDKLKANHKNTKSIPPNTEIFMEFIQRKPTLSRSYVKMNDVFVLASSPTTYTIKGGKIFTTSSGFDTSKRTEYAQMLGMKTPPVLFKGKLSEIGNDLESVKQHFIKQESTLGGKGEGVVLTFSDGTIIKIVQPDQYDKAMRGAIKAKFAPVDSIKYWEAVRKIAFDLMKDVNPSDSFRSSIARIADQVHATDYPELDANRKPIVVKEDIITTVKMLLTRKMPGNNWAMYLGRFSPISSTHKKILENALKKYDGVVLVQVKSKTGTPENPFPVELQQEMLHKCFDQYGDRVEYIITGSGNIGTILGMAKQNINVILCGTDRVEGYRGQLAAANNKDVTVEEIPRTDGVSGTKVRQAIKDNDQATFKANTPKEIWPMFDQLKKYIDAAK